MRNSRAILILLLLLGGGFALATVLAARAPGWTGRSPSDSVLKLLLGDSRRMFANHFFVKADISFHSGYYPSIFDQARQAEERENHVAHPEQEAEAGTGFLDPPTDWIDRFGRHFRVTEHTHLEGGDVREILPWLRISADLDPHRIDTYTTAAYWLRKSGKSAEAKRFLREGLQANPDSCAILFDLGCLYQDDDKDAVRARNMWELALRKWNDSKSAQPDKAALAECDEILTRLAALEENEGHFTQAARDLEQILARDASPNPDIVRQHIAELRQKSTAPSR